MSLNSKWKSLCQLATTELLSQRDKEKGNTKKMTKARLGLSLSTPADPYFLAWWLLQQRLRRKVFLRFKRIKTELKGGSVPREVAYTKRSLF